MIKTLLIANRGEIACRIIQTARRLGIKTIAIYSTVDAQSRHVQLADMAFWVGDAKAQESYLNIEAIINIARHQNVNAIHPGYGFLSENVKFAEACDKAQIIFIGPSISAMEAMASKQTAKQLLENTSVPLTPGYHGVDQSDARLLKEAQHIGFPILIKAAAGGGGKGMREVHTEAEFSSALEGAKREAKASFADDTMIIEKRILKPRHIEIQIMADHHGQVVHLFERDCSIQRRHQKIIEEAPAPQLSSALRQKIAAAAIEVAKAIDYRGAGTIEFLVAGEEFYFMEMNTRLQVEHPVTEMITQLDLVEWQLRIAANEPLPLTQEQIKCHGHAIECRIYAEDPMTFLPSIGKVHFLKEPASNPQIRIDTGITQGTEVTRFYDPMLAKLIVWGETRTEALQRLQAALLDYHIGGIKTNLSFLQAILDHPKFKEADLSTAFLQVNNIQITKPNLKQALIVAVCMDYLSHQSHDPLERDTFSWQMHLSSQWHARFQVAEQIFEICITPQNPSRFSLQITGEEAPIELSPAYNRGRLSYHDRNQRHEIFVEICRSGYWRCYLDQGPVEINRVTWASQTLRLTSDATLCAPMPAIIVAVLKQVGDKIRMGERLIVLEAMKMEHTIHAPHEGQITEIFYPVGAQVSEGVPLLALERDQ